MKELIKVRYLILVIAIYTILSMAFEVGQAKIKGDTHGTNVSPFHHVIERIPG